MKLFRNLFFAFLLFLLLFAGVKKAFSMSAFQQNETARRFEERFNQAVKSPDMNLESFFGMAITNTLVWTNKAVGGETRVVQGPNGPVYTREGGAIDVIANLTGTLYTVQPASSVEYLAYVGNNLGIVKPAYAQQGIGFQAFSPVLTLWKTFRDIAYLGFVIIFVVVGLMIMFRRKIDPRTVVTVQEALPRIVVALILVTFSYAIAGLVIDAVYLSTRLGVNLLAGKFIAIESTGAPGVSTTEKISRLLNSDIFHLVNPLRDVGDLVAPFKDIALSGEGQVIAALAGLTVGVVFWMLGFYVMFKIFFALIGPYVSIVLSIVFAPIMLLFGALPGNQTSTTNWLKGLIANVAVFPVTFIMLVMAAIFKSGPLLCKPYGGWEITSRVGGILFSPADWATSCEPFGINLWMAPGIGNWGHLVGQLISFGILFAIPNVADMVKQSLEVKPGIAQQIAGQEIRGGLGRLPFVGSLLPK